MRESLPEPWDRGFDDRYVVMRRGRIARVRDFFDRSWFQELRCRNPREITRDAQDKSLIGPGQVGDGYQVEDRDDGEDAPPRWFVAGFGDGHPQDDWDDDVHERDEEEDDPPDGLPGNVDHENHVGNGDPGEPGVGSLRFFGDGHEREGREDIESRADYEKHQEEPAREDGLRIGIVRIDGGESGEWKR